MEDEKIYFTPGMVVTLRQDIPNKPTMLVVRKKTMTIKGDDEKFLQGIICRWFTNYMNKIYLANQKSKVKTVVNASDVKSGLNVMIVAASLEPIFTGQAKEFLSKAFYMKRQIKAKQKRLDWLRDIVPGPTVTFSDELKCPATLKNSMVENVAIKV